MTLLLISVLLALTWAAITGTFSLGNLILGFVIGGMSLWVIRLQVGQAQLLRKIPKILSLAALFLYELLMSAIKVLILVLSPNMHKKLQPAIIAFPLKAKSDAEITLLANLITLTPGTLSVDVSPDRSSLYVHALEMPDKKKMIKDIANGFEAKIIEVFEQ
ncbi:multicomponent Na+:H+ antiporter subunit E [Maritalea mobilis]|uniref:Multicomponent Na+:H+ antiporter subunit E n=1 Tax=Maritalea mobilis TaxID=483324 RepID=A0A4R6VUF9_9HYPH|nr:Na+/H+ antiporter subunit E [Maritalea mobilis]TDQ63851.1 multicomponent Na+:H+ antiporter subunit E [Maritalea mobilis]